MKKETLSSIAERTGFSVTTVSRVLCGNAAKYRICKATEDIIVKEARRCAYTPVTLAQKFRTKHTKTIGLLVPSVSNPYFADLASGIITELDRNGYLTIVMDTMESETKMVDNARSLAQRNIDGIIAVPCGDNPVALERINQNVPVVLVDRFYSNSDLPYVTTNNYKGSVEACDILLSRGYKKIVCIQGELSSGPNRERVKGYYDTMKVAGLEDVTSVVGNEFSIQNGYLETKLLLNKKESIDAIFALSNTIVLGAMKAIREVGLRIPEDIAIVSFDDNMYMEYLTPALTRVSQPVGDMAKLAARILLDRINNPADIRISQLKLSPSIIYGASV